jgi:hypothetical protein
MSLAGHASPGNRGPAPVTAGRLTPVTSTQGRRARHDAVCSATGRSPETITIPANSLLSAAEADISRARRRINVRPGCLADRLMIWS